MASNLRRPVMATPAAEQEKIGLVVYLIMLYMFLDLVRPAFVWHFPKIIAVILTVAWIAKAEKVNCTQIVGFVLFVAVLAIDVVFAANTFDAVWTTYGMFMLLIGICVPMINFTNTLPRLRHVVN